MHSQNAHPDEAEKGMTALQKELARVIFDLYEFFGGQACFFWLHTSSIRHTIKFIRVVPSTLLCNLHQTIYWHLIQSIGSFFAHFNYRPSVRGSGCRLQPVISASCGPDLAVEDQCRVRENARHPWLIQKFLWNKDNLDL